MKKVLLLFCLIGLMPSILMAQQLTNRERRRINIEVLKALNQYEATQTLRGDVSKYQFLDLFENQDTLIYCDLLDYATNDDKINLQTYVDLLSKKTFVEARIKDVVKLNPQRRDDGWHTQVSFEKTLDYIDENEVWFSSKEYYRAPYQITIDFVYNEDDERCYIADISGNVESSELRLPKKFMVVQYQSEEDTKMRLQNKEEEEEYLVFNDFQQTFVKGEEIKPWKDDHRLKYDTLATADNYNLVKLKHRKTPWRLQLRYGYAPKGIYEITSPIDGLQSNSSGYEIGLDIGITFSLGAGSMGFFVGAGMQQSNISLSHNNIRYSQTASYTPSDNNFNSEDVLNGYSVVRNYSISLAEENISYTDIVVPVSLVVEPRLFKAMYLTFNVGAKLYLNQNTSISPLHIIGNAKVGNETNDQNISGDYSNFIYPCSYSPDTTMELLKSIGLSKASLSLIGSVGFNFNLWENHILLTTKVGYEYGLANVYSQKFAQNHAHIFPSSTDSNPFTPILYSDAEKKYVAAYSLMGFTAAKRQALWLEGGLMFKF